MENNTDVKACVFVHLDVVAVQEAYASYIINIVLNSILAPPTVIFNIIVIVAIWRTSSLHTPSNILICSLSLSDLCIGLITQPFYVAYKFSEINHKFEEYCEAGVQVVALFSSYFLGGMSFYVLTAMSIDRYLALHLGMRYRPVVTASRMTKLVIAIWIFAAFIGSLQIFLESKTFFRVIASLMMICLTIITFAYTKAFKSLKRHQLRVGTNTSPFNDMNKYRKSLRAVLYLLGLILLCYVPHLCVFIAILIKGLNGVTRAAKNIANPIVFANSCMNPVIYCWKIKEIRHACRNTFRKLLRRTRNHDVTDNGIAGRCNGTDAYIRRVADYDLETVEEKHAGGGSRMHKGRHQREDSE